MTSSPLLAAAERLEQELQTNADQVRQAYGPTNFYLNAVAAKMDDSADTLSRLCAALGQANGTMENVRRFSASKARQFSEQAFGDSRVEDAANVLEDISLMSKDALALPVSAPPPASD